VFWADFVGLVSLHINLHGDVTQMYTPITCCWREEKDQWRKRVDFKQIRVEVLNELTWIIKGIRYSPLLAQG
jgi:hypothetical protein